MRAKLKAKEDLETNNEKLLQELYDYKAKYVESQKK